MSITFPSNSSGVTLLTTQVMQVVMDATSMSIPDMYGIDNCLGGYNSMTQIPAKPQNWSPSIYPTLNYGGQTKIFRDITSAELTTGVTLYRCIAIGYSGNTTTGAVTNLTATITNYGTEATVTLATSAAGIIIASETTAPSPTLTYSNPLLISSSYTARTTTPLLWIKYVVPALSSPAHHFHNFFGLTISSNNYTEAHYYFFNNWRADSFISSVTSDKQDEIIGLGTTVQYTVACKSAAGAAADFDGTTRGLPVLTTMSSPYPRIDYTRYETLGFKDGFTQLNIARRTATGIYVLEWDPPFPGVFKHSFSLGYDEYNYTQWVVPHVR